MKKSNQDIKDLIKEVESDFEKRRIARRPFELQWRLNMDFVSGNQYNEITARGDIEDFGKRYYWEEREVYNHIASLIETRIAKVSKVKADVTVRPFSSEESDINAARLATDLAKSVSECNNLTDKLMEAVTWVEYTGTCFLKAVWDSDFGHIVGKTEKGENIREGEVRVTVVPPYELYPDSIASSRIDDCLSIIHAKAYDIKDIKNNWGVDVEGENIQLFTMGDENTISLSNKNAMPDITSAVVENHCVVIERYTKPTKDRPNGELVIVAGGKLLYQGDLPYINKCDGERGYPFVRLNCMNRAGCFFGTSIVERMIPLQRAYNAVRNKKHEYMNRLVMGVLAVEDGSIDFENLEEEGLAPGKVIVYRQGSNPPTMVNFGDVPSEFIQEENKILEEFTVLSGVSELSKYSQTFGNMSGKAIQLLVDQDDTRISTTASNIRNALKELYRQAIMLYKQFANNRRLIRSAGEWGEVTVKYFSASDLSCSDLIFDNESDLSDNLTSRRNMVLQLVNMGILNDEGGGMSPRNRSKVLELLGFGAWDSATDIEDTHRRKALKENAKMHDLKVDEHDDHSIHIEEHIKALFSEDSQQDKLASLNEHIREHEYYQYNIAFQNTIKGESNAKQ